MNNKDLFKLIFTSNLKVKSEALGVYSIGQLKEINSLEIKNKIMGLFKDDEMNREYPKDFGDPIWGGYTTFDLVLERLGITLVANDIKFTDSPKRGLLELSFNKYGKAYALSVQDIF